MCTFHCYLSAGPEVGKRRQGCQPVQPRGAAEQAVWRLGEVLCVGGGPWGLWDGVDLGPEFLPLVCVSQSVCSCLKAGDELTGWPCRVCVCVRVTQTKTEVGGTAAAFGGTLCPQHRCGARALSSSPDWLQPRVSLVMGQGWIVC